MSGATSPPASSPLDGACPPPQGTTPSHTRTWPPCSWRGAVPQLGRDSGRATRQLPHTRILGSQGKGEDSDGGCSCLGVPAPPWGREAEVTSPQ